MIAEGTISSPLVVNVLGIFATAIVTWWLSGVQLRSTARQQWRDTVREKVAEFGSKISLATVYGTADQRDLCVKYLEGGVEASSYLEVMLDRKNKRHESLIKEVEKCIVHSRGLVAGRRTDDLVLEDVYRLTHEITG